MIIRTLFSITLSIFALQLPNSFGGQEENLLANENFVPDPEGVITHWRVPTYPFEDDPSVAEQLTWGVEDVNGSKCLTIATKDFVKANVWWEQLVKGFGGSSYEISVKVKGELYEGSKYGKGTVGVHFLDSNGQYLSYQALPDVEELSDTWQVIKGTITAPDDAVEMGFRMGALFDGEIKVFFKDPSLTESSE